MRRRRRSYRFGAAEDSGALRVTPGSRFEIEPASRSSSSGTFLTPKVGNVLVGVGALSALGAVGYYIWKGGELGNLWDALFDGSGAEEKKKFQEAYASGIKRGMSQTAAARNAYVASKATYSKSLYE